MHGLNSYAVVAYLNGSLASFVENLRREFTPGCSHRAHITILPPRPLQTGVAVAIEYCRDVLARQTDFEVRPVAVGLFDTTGVIKLSLESEDARLSELHKALNDDVLRHEETYGYVPHITLAQAIPSANLAARLESARLRWKGFGKPLPVLVRTLTFVQQITNDRWRDLASIHLAEREASREPAGDQVPKD